VGGGLLGVITLAGLLLGEPAGLAPLTLGQTGVIGETDALTGLGCALAAIAVARWIGAWRHGGRRFAAACAPVVIATLIGIGAGVAIALARMPFDR
jgi:hypothetical protein